MKIKIIKKRTEFLKKSRKEINLGSQTNSLEERIPDRVDWVKKRIEECTDKAED